MQRIYRFQKGAKTIRAPNTKMKLDFLDHLQKSCSKLRITEFLEPFLPIGRKTKKVNIERPTSNFE